MPAPAAGPGRRSTSWAAIAIRGATAPSWRRPTTRRCAPPLRSAADARACLDALLDGTVDAIATDHAPHTQVDKDVEFGLARPGIAGIETALGVVLELVDAGLLPLARMVDALTAGPARVLPSAGARVGFEVGTPADLVVFDRAERWTVGAGTLRTRGYGNPLDGRQLPGVVLTLLHACATGRLAYEAPEPD